VKTLYCITCPIGCKLTIAGSGYDIVVDGNKCEKGQEFAEVEMTNPTRTLTTTVRTRFPGVPVLSVRTDGEIPKNKLMEAMRELSQVVIEEELGCGDTVLEDVADTGVSVIVTSSALMQLGAELENKNVEIGKPVSAGGASAAMVIDFGIGDVRNSGTLDDLNSGAADGFVGAAGEAVGVENAEEDDLSDEDLSAEKESGGIRMKKSRPHIKR